MIVLTNNIDPTVEDCIAVVDYLNYKFSQKFQDKYNTQFMFEHCMHGYGIKFCDEYIWDTENDLREWLVDEDFEEICEKEDFLLYIEKEARTFASALVNEFKNF